MVKKYSLTKKCVNVYQQIESIGSIIVNLLNFLLDCCCCRCCWSISHSFVIVRTTGDDGVDGNGESMLLLLLLMTIVGRIPLGRLVELLNF